MTISQPKRHLLAIFASLLAMTMALPTLAADFPPDTVDPAQSTVDISPKSVVANGYQSAKLTVNLKNFSGSPLPNKKINVYFPEIYNWDWSISTTPVGAVTDANGQATLFLKSSTPQTTKVSVNVGTILTPNDRITFTTSTCPYQPKDFFPGEKVPGLRLIKLPDDSNPATHEDSVVYYYGKDCYRHAFPDEKTYFTWYANFAYVDTVSPTVMAKMPLGKNVTHKPGFRMIKFPSIDKVYAIGRGGVLHWIPTEALADALYGASAFPNDKPWNQKVDDVSEAFYTDYSMGSEIQNVGDIKTADYDIVNEESLGRTIDDNW